MSGFISELKHRNVIRMAGLYLVGAWLLTQVASTLLPTCKKLRMTELWQRLGQRKLGPATETNIGLRFTS